MFKGLPQPDRNRLSAMTALVALTYTLIRIVVLPSLQTEFEIVGLFVRLDISTRTMMLALAAVITATGADWLIRSHPQYDQHQSSLEHLVIPGLAALAAGAVLTRLPEGPALWIGVPLTAILLMGVLLAEFIVNDADDPRYDFAAVLLKTLAFTLLIGVFFVIRSTSMRAIFSVPVIFLSSGAVVWRLQRLDNQEGVRALLYAGVIGWISAQIGWALHYWPVAPLRYALILGLLVYIGNGLLDIQREGEFNRARWTELVIVGSSGLLAILLLT